ncbi:ParA family protein [Sorangium sp. So ce513]|uniref:ParA family protein n=1 Tax=Sorangium sp. So ce513 TaxID=3133315 RepID=UPI003F5FAE5B
MSASSQNRPVRFDEALERAKEFLKLRGAELGDQVIVVRDLYGRISLALDADRRPSHADLALELHARLGAYSPGDDDIFLFRGEMFAPDAVFAAEDALPLLEGNKDVRLLDRRLVGQDWTRGPLRGDDAAGPPRATFFGLKGGVGRSTALAVLAYRLAKADRKVLIVDLDLESPGLSTTLLPGEALPDFGVVDWLVEEGVGQADESLLRDMVQTSPLVSDTAGEIRVVPAGGSKGDYLAKLTRSYMEAEEAGRTLSFAERLEVMLDQLEAQEQPDVVLLDSRAGLHDLAAITVTRLGAMAFLFAGNTAQTWHGYDLLFQQWSRHPARARAVRENLKIVAGLVPETDRDRYLPSLLESSHSLFARRLYDAVPPGAVSTFNYDLHDSSAPHHPLEIYWTRALQEFDPVRRPQAVPEDQLEIAFGRFVRGAAELLGIPLR